jgi:hypothetical protein
MDGKTVKEERLRQQAEKVFECAEHISMTILREFSAPDLNSRDHIVRSLIGAAAALVASCENSETALAYFTYSLEYQLSGECIYKRGS